MKKQMFIDTYVKNLIEKDKDVKKYFDIAKTAEERELLERGLKQALDNAYTSYAKEYFDTKGLGSYFSTFLRWTGAAADVVGTYAFWALGGAGFVSKGVGLLEKTVADYIDNKHYEKYKDKDLGKVSKEGLEIITEGILERAAAYLPIGVGELADLLRGTKKYDSKIVLRALYRAKNSFIKQFGDYKRKEPPIVVPLKTFRNPAYTLDDRVRKAA